MQRLFTFFSNLLRAISQRIYEKISMQEKNVFSSYVHIFYLCIFFKVASEAPVVTKIEHSGDRTHRRAVYQSTSSKPSGLEETPY